MRMNFKVSFYLRSNYENKEGKSPVMLRVFLNGEMANFGSTKIFVDKTLWNNATSRLKGRSTEALSVNAALDSISTTLNGIFHKFENDETLSLDKIRSYFMGKDREYTTFLPVFDKFNDDIRQRVGHTISQDSLQKYSVLRRHFGEFLLYRYSRKDIGLTELTPAVIQDFELYLSTVAGCSYNTSVKKMKTLKTITIYAQKRGYLLHDPFLNHRFHLEP
ncbi:phage integrase SAM-like domain and Arm DNA-binding domain-containing protein, partial [Bacteroides heparinolyticus]|uniref:phage integrase SAM-like domain and Arm DNA-binding domain-containing protein n=2 Tax=Bacteroidales TaxID=171549 RepID=UPI0035A14261